MRPKPCDLDSMIQAAQTETATPDAEARAVAALRKPLPRPSFVTVPRVAVAAVAAVAVLLLPLATPRSAGAWAQVTATMANQVRYHEKVRMVFPGGKVSESERWVDGNRYSFQMGERFGRMGSDGKKQYQYFAQGKSMLVWKASKDSAQAYLSGLGNIPSFSVDDLIKGDKVRPVGEAKEIDTSEGKRLVYSVEYLSDPKDGKVEVTSTGKFYVAPGDPRIRRWELLDKKGEPVYSGTLEYPDHIPDEVFAFKPPVGTQVFDIDAGNAQIRKTMERGFGTKSVGGQSVTLRAVISSPEGNYLTVLWTGAPPNGDLLPRVKAEGLSTKLSYGLSTMTTKVYEYVPPAKKLDYLPTHLGGMTLVSHAKVPDKVTLLVPVFAPDPKRPVHNFEGKPTGYRSRFVGTVTYRDVPVLRLGPFHMYLNALGLREPRPYEALIRDYGRKPR